MKKQKRCAAEPGAGTYAYERFGRERFLRYFKNVKYNDT